MAAHAAQLCAYFFRRLCGRLLQLFVGRTAVGGRVCAIRGDGHFQSRRGGGVSSQRSRRWRISAGAGIVRGVSRTRTADRCAAAQLRLGGVVEQSMLSVVVNFFNNRREAMNTLYSLTRTYQRDAGDIEFEVIAIDHGSTQPLDADVVRAFGPEFRYRYVETDAVSPVAAINAACTDALGNNLIVIVDGAHILSPGIYALANRALTQFASPFVASVSFHLG